jgi:gas vesicle protein
MMFLFGLIIGGILGIFIMALFAAGKMRSHLEDTLKPMLKP